MLKLVTLPVMVALSSWAPVPNATAPAPAQAQQSSDRLAQAVDSITCPLTGEKIPSCCCPVKR